MVDVMCLYRGHLGAVVVHAGLHALDAVVVHGVGGQRDDGHAPELDTS